VSPGSVLCEENGRRDAASQSTVIYSTGFSPGNTQTATCSCFQSKNERG
jgi:hypothetical protein